jgi:hypothetical protein
MRTTMSARSCAFAAAILIGAALNAEQPLRDVRKN